MGLNKVCLNKMCLKKNASCAITDYRMLLWCSLVEPTPCVPRRPPWQQFSPPLKNCHGFPLAGSGALRTPLPARLKPWQFLRWGENCCDGDRLGTQAVRSTSGQCPPDTTMSTAQGKHVHSTRGHWGKKLTDSTPSKVYLGTKATYLL